MSGNTFAPNTNHRCVGVDSLGMANSTVEAQASLELYAPEITLSAPTTIKTGATVTIKAGRPQVQTQILNEGFEREITLPSVAGANYTLEEPIHGTLTGTAPNLTYIPEQGYFGNDSFGYAIDDGVNPPTFGVVNLTVNQYTPSPKQVQLVSLSSTATDSVTADWLPTQDDVTPESQLKYTLHLSTDAKFTPQTSTAQGQTTGGLSMQVSGLSPGTQYHAIVVAEDEDDNVAWSNPLSVTTLASNPVRTAQTVRVQTADNAPTANDGSVTYSADGGEIPQVGDVLASQEGEGYLRKVIAVSENNGEVTATTEPASLNELYSDLDLTANVKLVSVPESASRTRSASFPSAIRGKEIGGREFEWRKTGLHLYDANTSTENQRSTTLENDRLYIDGEYARVDAPAYVSTEPNQKRTFDLNVTHVYDDGEAWKHRELCRIDLLDFTHKDSDLEQKAVDLGRPSATSHIADDQLTGRISVSWTPPDVLVDPEGRPYIAKFRIYVGEKDENCNGDGWGSWDDTMDVEIPFYVIHGEMPADEKKSLVFSGDAGIEVTNDVDFEFAPEFNIEAQIRYAALQNALVRIDSPVNFKNVFTISAFGEGGINAEKYLLEPRKFVKVFMAGGVPIVISGEFSIKAQLNGNISGQMELKKTLGIDIDASFGLEYDKNRTDKWQVIKTFGPTVELLIEGDAEASAYLELRLIPDLRITFYDTASGRMLVEPYVYGKAGLQGHFLYNPDPINAGWGGIADMDYWFTKLEAGMGMDLRLYAGLSIFDYDLVSYPSAANGVDDTDNFDLYHPFAKTPFIGLPELTASVQSDQHPTDSRAILVEGSHTNIPNPFGGESLKPFSRWTPPDVIPLNSPATMQPLTDVASGRYWFSYDEPGEYTARLAGYSEIGWFVRQITEVPISITDNDQDGMADQWEARYSIDDPNADPDEDLLTNLEEFEQGKFPTTFDNPLAEDDDNDGMLNGWEIDHGFDPANPNDASGDKDGDGYTNLQEHDDGSDPTNPADYYYPSPTLNAQAGEQAITYSWNPYLGGLGEGDYYALYLSDLSIRDFLDSFGMGPSDRILRHVTSPYVDDNLAGGSMHYGMLAVFNKVSDDLTRVTYSNEVVSLVTGAPAPLNDTGILGCANGSSNGLACPVTDYPNQDAEQGRDVTANDDSDGHAGFSFTKLDASGNPLPADAPDWACVKDQVTGLVWEVKTDDDGLHDKDDRYNWYSLDHQSNGGDKGFVDDDGAVCAGYQADAPESYCNTHAFIQRVNAAGLCGASDWRLPTTQELRGIALLEGPSPTIDANYFPNTASTYHWTAYPRAADPAQARTVSFSTGDSDFATKDNAYATRLVHGGQDESADFDFDGMPDRFETAFGLNPADETDADMDGDGDLMTNLWEYQQGLNPQVFNEPPGGKINDSAIVGCADGDSNSVGCPLADYPNQDAQNGRDITHADHADGRLGFSFTKLNENGDPMPADARGWRCVRDNVTGLIWEVKTNDGGLHDRDDGYNWYSTDPLTNGGDKGYVDNNGAVCSGYAQSDPASYCNTQAFVRRVNAEGLCGISDWRLPTTAELRGLAILDGGTPTIESTYFPNTQATYYWTAYPRAGDATYGRTVDFNTGDSDFAAKDNPYKVRLVKGMEEQDSDNDGMPDSFERLYGMDLNDSADALHDPDWDDITNLEEYQQGLNPKIYNAEPGGKINDSGILGCANGDSNNVGCPLTDYPNQDAENGRDQTHNDPADGRQGFSFTKLDASGNPMPADALGWRCVRDNVTGLIWENKTHDGGLHDRAHLFTWYNDNASTNGGASGTLNPVTPNCHGHQPDDASAACNTQAFIARVNAQGLCGASDWRLPITAELRGLAILDGSNPAIEASYFSDTLAAPYWSANPRAGDANYGRIVDFSTGDSDFSVKSNAHAVRLVRGG